eukprot:XP_001710192.1 Hypothetical protein GL50803_38413 [Giardia lamblia ATCC 50803]
MSAHSQRHAHSTFFGRLPCGQRCTYSSYWYDGVCLFICCFWDCC